MWNFYSPKRTTFGKNSVAKIAEEFHEFPGKHPLFVLPKRLLEVSAILNIFENLKSKNVNYAISTQVAQEAPVEYVQKIYDDFRINNCDSIIAIGGGSVLDLAKAASILTTNGGQIDQYFGINNVPKPTVPKIFIPTTSGTGSEATNISVLGNKSQKSKKGIVSNYLFADWIILDPTLTYSMSIDLVLSTGLDAFCQCVEGFTTKGAAPLVDIYALKGMDLISKNLISSLSYNEEAREAMLLGAYLSGVAITAGNSGTNIAHAIGNTIGGIYNSPHGLSVTAVFEQGLKFNAGSEVYRQRLDEIKNQIGLDVIAFVDQVKKRVKLPTLREIGVKNEDIPQISVKVISDQPRLIKNNQRDITQEDIEKILQASL